MNLYNRLFMIAAMAVSVSLSASGKDTPARTIKLTSKDTTYLDMPVNINKMKGSLTVDTGAMHTIIKADLAQDLKLNLEATGTTSEGIGGDSDVMSGEITAYVPGHRSQDFPTLSGKHDFEVMSENIRVTSFGRDFGIIGLPELAAAGAVIDCAGSSMTLYPKGNFHSPKGSFELPMLRYTGMSKMMRRFSALFQTENIEGNFLWALPVTIAGKQGVMVVDTGAEASFISNTFAKRVGINPGGANFTAQGTNDSQQMTLCTLPDLLLGGKLQLGKIQVLSGELPTFHDVAGGDLPFIGILGIDQLRRIEAFFDCKRGIIYATRGPLKRNRPNPLAVDVTSTLKALVKAGDKEVNQML